MSEINSAGDDRTTAQGLFGYADAYFASAKSLMQCRLGLGHAEQPVRMLLYHSAELYLKAHLRATGCSVRKLERMGHRMSGIIDASRDQGLHLDEFADYLLKFGEETEDIIGSRYIETGYRTRFPTTAIGLVVA